MNTSRDTITICKPLGEQDHLPMHTVRAGTCWQVSSTQQEMRREVCISVLPLRTVGRRRRLLHLGSPLSKRTRGQKKRKIIAILVHSHGHSPWERSVTGYLSPVTIQTCLAVRCIPYVEGRACTVLCTSPPWFITPFIKDCFPQAKSPSKFDPAINILWSITPVWKPWKYPCSQYFLMILPPH